VCGPPEQCPLLAFGTAILYFNVLMLVAASRSCHPAWPSAAGVESLSIAMVRAICTVNTNEN